MSLLDSFRNNIKNIFVGSHRGDDFILENLTKKKEMPKNTNDLGVDPNEWFEDSKPHPHDSMPVATDKSWEDTAPSEYEPPDPEEEGITMHEKMYRIATAKYNPFSVGGSENINEFGGGSEEAHK